MLYGISPVEACLRAGRRPMTELLLRAGGGKRFQSLRELARERGVRVREVETHELGNLARTKHHQGAVLRCGDLPTVELEELTESRPCLVVALDQIEDPQNLGGIARSAAYFGAAGLLMTRAHSAPLSAAASKASAGALEILPVARVGNLAQSLRNLHKEDFDIVGADTQEGSTPATTWQPRDRCVLLLGSEGEGLRELSRKLCDLRLHIPGGGMESLNVSVACGILLQLWRSRVFSQQ